MPGSGPCTALINGSLSSLMECYYYQSLSFDICSKLNPTMYGLASKFEDKMPRVASLTQKFQTALAFSSGKAPFYFNEFVSTVRQHM